MPQDGQSVISDSVIFVRNPACNNYHGTSSGVPATSPSPAVSPSPVSSPSPASSPIPVPTPVQTVLPQQPINNPLQVSPCLRGCLSHHPQQKNALVSGLSIRPKVQHASHCMFAVLSMQVSRVTVCIHRH